MRQTTNTEWVKFRRNMHHMLMVKLKQWPSCCVKTSGCAPIGHPWDPKRGWMPGSGNGVDQCLDTAVCARNMSPNLLVYRDRPLSSSRSGSVAGHRAAFLLYQRTVHMSTTLLLLLILNADLCSLGFLFHNERYLATFWAEHYLSIYKSKNHICVSGRLSVCAQLQHRTFVRSLWVLVTHTWRSKGWSTEVHNRRFHIYFL